MRTIAAKEKTQWAKWAVWRGYYFIIYTQIAMAAQLWHHWGAAVFKISVRLYAISTECTAAVNNVKLNNKQQEYSKSWIISLVNQKKKMKLHKLMCRTFMLLTSFWKVGGLTHTKTSLKYFFHNCAEVLCSGCGNNWGVDIRCGIGPTGEPSQKTRIAYFQLCNNWGSDTWHHHYQKNRLEST